jgi:hypothetical protein
MTLPLYHVPADQAENCYRRSQAVGDLERRDRAYSLLVDGISPWRRQSGAIKKYRRPADPVAAGILSQKICASRPETLPREKLSLRSGACPRQQTNADQSARHSE